jgi:hypothetical protein
MKELSLNILDIVQNSIRAEATLISIEIRESLKENNYQIIITDNGKGIDEKILENVTDPFVTTRTKRKMGLGLPLLRYHAELAGGKVKIESEQGKGTVIKASFLLNHVDRQPLGDLAGVIKILLAANPDKDFNYRHVSDFGEYIFSSRETKDYLEAESLKDVDLLEDIGTLIRESLRVIKASV